MFEKVNPGHPDKMADRLAGAVVDLVYERAGGLAREFNLDYKMQELIREVSVTSYIRGTDVMLDTLKKEGKIRK